MAIRRERMTIPITASLQVNTEVICALVGLWSTAFCQNCSQVCIIEVLKMLKIEEPFVAVAANAKYYLAQCQWFDGHMVG